MLHKYVILLGYNLIASKNISILLKIQHFHKRPFWPTSSLLLINKEIIMIELKYFGYMYLRRVKIQ